MCTHHRGIIDHGGMLGGELMSGSSGLAGKFMAGDGSKLGVELMSGGGRLAGQFIIIGGGGSGMLAGKFVVVGVGVGVVVAGLHIHSKGSASRPDTKTI